MNGFETTEYIRKTLNNPVPIIALTADVTTVDLAKCRAVGMNDYLAKPIDERILYTKIVGLVQKPLAPKSADAKTKEPADKPPVTYIDLSYLHRLTKGNGKMKEEMISAYLDQTPVLIRSIKKALAERDWDLLYAAAHKMIPSFAMVGMSKEFEQLAKELQEFAAAAKSAAMPEAMEEAEKGRQVQLLEAACDHACAELQEELTVLKKVGNEK